MKTILLAALVLLVTVLAGCEASPTDDGTGTSTTSPTSGDVGCGGADNAWTFNLVTLDPPVACVQLKSQPAVTCGPMTAVSVGGTSTLTIASGDTTFVYDASAKTLEVGETQGTDPRTSSVILVSCP
jgi:hypothetical protein